MKQLREKVNEDGLTRREREVLFKLANGKILKEIANEAGVAIPTISYRLRMALRRHECSTNEQLIYKLSKRGIL